MQEMFCIISVFSSLDLSGVGEPMDWKPNSRREPEGVDGIPALDILVSLMRGVQKPLALVRLRVGLEEAGSASSIATSESVDFLSETVALEGVSCRVILAGKGGVGTKSAKPRSSSSSLLGSGSGLVLFS